MGLCFSDKNSELFGDTNTINAVSKARRPSYTYSTESKSKSVTKIYYSKSKSLSPEKKDSYNKSSL